MWTAGTKRPLFSKHSAQTKGASQLSLSPIIFSPSGLVPLVKYSKYCSSFQAGKGLFKSPSAILIAFKYLGLLRNLSHAKRLWEVSPNPCGFCGNNAATSVALFISNGTSSAVGPVTPMLSDLFACAVPFFTACDLPAVGNKSTVIQKT